MKFNCGLSPDERFYRRMHKKRIERNRLQSWHTKFAWFPVRLTSAGNEHTCVWLEPYERKGKYFDNTGYDMSNYWEWEYRPFTISPTHYRDTQGRG
jgi:hypothetical protein